METRLTDTIRKTMAEDMILKKCPNSLLWWKGQGSSCFTKERAGRSCKEGSQTHPRPQKHPEFHQTDPVPIRFLPPVETFLLLDTPSPENSSDLTSKYYLQFTETRVQSDCSEASDRLEMLYPFPSPVIPSWLEPFRMVDLECPKFWGSVALTKIVTSMPHTWHIY